jgi:site-specific recombinase XerD
MARKPAKVKGLKWREDRCTWEARYDVNGKRVRKSFNERAHAIAWLETARGLKHKEGLDCLPTSAAQPLLTAAEKKAIREERINGLTLNDLCDQYLTHIQNPNNPERLKDLVNPPQRIEVIKAAFGDRAAASIKPHEIKDWLISLGLAGGTLNRYKSTLSAVYTYAKERELVESNPCRDVPHFTVILGIPRWMSDEEEDKLRAVIKKWIDDTPEHHEITRLELREHLNEITVGSQTGMRKGNQYALEWPDVDFRLRLITLPDTKNGHPHTVPMTDDVYNALKNQQAIQTRMQELRSGKVRKRMKLDGRVFTISENREWFEKAKSEAKVKDLGWHQLSRHTAGSRLAASDASLKVIQEVLGHKTIAMSARYTHLSKAHVADAMKALNRPTA